MLRERVHLRLGTLGASEASIVEDVLETDLIVTAPMHLAEGQQAKTGDALVVAWDDANGPHQLPCELIAVLTRDVPNWQVRPPRRAPSGQRRRHVRVAQEDALTLVRDRQAFAGTVTDLSEGG